MTTHKSNWIGAAECGAADGRLAPDWPKVDCALCRHKGLGEPLPAEPAMTESAVPPTADVALGLLRRDDEPTTVVAVKQRTRKVEREPLTAEDIAKASAPAYMIAADPEPEPASTYTPGGSRLMPGAVDLVVGVDDLPPKGTEVEWHGARVRLDGIYTEPPLALWTAMLDGADGSTVSVPMRIEDGEALSDRLAEFEADGWALLIDFVREAGRNPADFGLVGGSLADADPADVAYAARAFERHGMPVPRAYQNALQKAPAPTTSPEPETAETATEAPAAGPGIHLTGGDRAASPHGLIAVDESLSDVAGAIIWWRGSSVPAEMATLTEAWEDAGLDTKLLPALPSPEHALKETMRAEGNRRRLVRPLAKSAGYALVDETAQDDQLDYGVQLTVRVERDANNVASLVFDPPTHSLAPKIAIEWKHNSERISSSRMTSWIVTLIRGVDAVGLRDTGGVYFVPRTTLDRWRTMVRAIEDASGYRVFEVPSLQSESAVAAILDAVLREAEREADAITTDLDAIERGESELGKRALRTRVDGVEQLIAKMKRYEELLHSGRDTAMHERLSKLKARATAAVLSTENDDGGAA